MNHEKVKQADNIIEKMEFDGWGYSINHDEIEQEVQPIIDGLKKQKNELLTNEYVQKFIDITETLESVNVRLRNKTRLHK